MSFILFELRKIGTFPLCKGFGLDFCRECNSPKSRELDINELQRLFSPSFIVRPKFGLNRKFGELFLVKL
jgi:hypothetical protein